MTTTRHLVETTAAHRVYEIRSGTTVVGRDVETIPTADAVAAATLTVRARAALAANRAFLDIATPSAAQNAAQINALTRQVNALARIMLGALDSTDD